MADTTDARARILAQLGDLNDEDLVAILDTCESLLRRRGELVERIGSLEDRLTALGAELDQRDAAWREHLRTCPAAP